MRGHGVGVGDIGEVPGSRRELGGKIPNFGGKLGLRRLQVVFRIS